MAFTKLASLWKKKDKHDKEYLQGQLDPGVAGNINLMIYGNKIFKEGQPAQTMYIVTKNK